MINNFTNLKEFSVSEISLSIKKHIENEFTLNGNLRLHINSCQSCQTTESQQTDEWYCRIKQAASNNDSSMFFLYVEANANSGSTNNNEILKSYNTI